MLAILLSCFPWLFPDHFGIPWLFQVFQVSGHPAYPDTRCIVMATDATQTTSSELTWCTQACCSPWRGHRHPRTSTHDAQSCQESQSLSRSTDRGHIHPRCCPWHQLTHNTAHSSSNYHWSLLPRAPCGAGASK